MKNNMTTESRNAIGQESKANYTKGEKILLVIFVLLVTWLLVCTVSAFWLDLHVPVSKQDLAYASWRDSYSTQMFLGGAMRIGLIVLTVTMALGIAIVKQSGKVLLLGILAASAVFQAGSEVTIVRVGIDTGAIKIGCFVYESKECHDMLGIRSNSAPSIYASETQRSHGHVYADWYVEALPSHASSFIDLIPGGYLLRTPFLIGRESELRDKIKTQRAEVEAVQKKS